MIIKKLEFVKNVTSRFKLIMKRFQEKYQKEIAPLLKKEWQLDNIAAVPMIEKVIVSMGIAQDYEDKAALLKAKESLRLITGQKPEVCRAKKSIADFSLRQGAPIGLKVTLRRGKMGDFLDKFFNIVLPQVKDFRGLSLNSFDGHGNYSIGLTENIVFPEVSYDKMDRARSLEITIVTNTVRDDWAKRLLELSGAPFEKEENEKN